MRLIDADALMMHLADIKLTESPDERDNSYYKRDRQLAVMVGIEYAEDAVKEAPTIGGWVSVKDRMPETGKHVLASCEIRLIYGGKKRYVCEAFYAAKHSLPEGKYPEDDECFDYDEEEDAYYLKEGWYECIHNWDEYSSVVIEDFVTHWMSLPEPPKEDDA